MNSILMIGLSEPAGRDGSIPSASVTPAESSKNGSIFFVVLIAVRDDAQCNVRPVGTGKKARTARGTLACRERSGLLDEKAGALCPQDAVFSDHDAPRAYAWPGGPE